MNKALILLIAIAFVAWLLNAIITRFGWLDFIVFTSIGLAMLFLFACGIIVLGGDTSHG